LAIIREKAFQDDRFEHGIPNERSSRYREGVREAVASLLDPFQPDSDEASRLSADKRYVLVTCLALVDQRSNSDLTLGERCDLPESKWWTRQTLARMVASFPLLNFGMVQSDAIYLAPGSERDGLSMEDLHGGGYEYLKPLE